MFKTTIAIDQKQVDECIQALMSNSKNLKRLIGVDTLSSRTAPGITSIAVLHLCDGNQSLIVRLTSFHTIPESLYNFLSLPGFTFVGFGINDAMSRLWNEYGFVCKNTFEARSSLWCSDTDSYVNFVVRTMHVPPTQCISDIWDCKGNLTEDLIDLTVSNAIAALRIGDKLLYPIGITM
ncbi:unnamed protein product [Arabidopsis arenosa]|uniref:3'-5' exonuclease domain-containing protein n=1 Tax=Arabidopsis arenosa TaxID=38785 RepID=A0A8S2AYX1_ARAAE|nr:unnamed protein product [Arabidopsis arenosa]